MTSKHRFFRSAISTLALAASLAVSGAAHAGSVSSSDTWAADYEGMALPSGTLLVFDYVGYQTNNNFVDTHGNALGGKADLFTDYARVSYFTRLADMPLVLEAALPYAQFTSNPTIAGQVKSSKGGFFSPVVFATLGLIVDPKRQTYLGLTNYLYLPGGAFNSSKQINIATDSQVVWVPQIGWSQGLGNKFAVDVIANASVHSNGNNPVVLPIATPLGGPGVAYDHVTQDTTYDIKGFLRYDFMQLGHLSVGLEKSWGGLQQYTGGVLGNAPMAFGGGPLQVSKDDFLRGHIQATMPLAADFQVGVDLTHDFDHTGGYREDFGAEVRLTKFFLPTAPATAPTK